MVFVALDIQHALRIRHIILSYVSYLALQYLSTLISQTARFSGGRDVTEHKMWCDFLYDVCPKHFLS